MESFMDLANDKGLAKLNIPITPTYSPKYDVEKED